MIFQNISLGPTILSGILHPKSCILGDTSMKVEQETKASSIVLRSPNTSGENATTFFGDVDSV